MSNPDSHPEDLLTQWGYEMDDARSENARLRATLAKTTEALTAMQRCICPSAGGLLGCPVHHPTGALAEILSDPDGQRALAERQAMERVVDAARTWCRHWEGSDMSHCCVSSGCGEEQDLCASVEALDTLRRAKP